MIRKYENIISQGYFRLQKCHVVHLHYIYYIKCTYIYSVFCGNYDTFYFSGFFEEQKVKKHLFEIEILCNIINVFTVTFDFKFYKYFKIFTAFLYIYIYIYNINICILYIYIYTHTHA